MTSQKEISFTIISALRSEGKSDKEILLVGPHLLLESFKRGEWEKKSGSTEDSEMIKYGKGLLSNWMRKDERLNGGVVVKKTTEKKGDETNLRTILEYVRANDPTNPLVIELEEKLMWEERKAM